jgi:ATP-dependent Clp protease protease subunit
MHYVKCQVRTICVGIAASMAAVLLAGGSKGKRVALPNSQIMIHEPRSGFGYQTVSDVEIDVKQIQYLRTRLANILASSCNLPLKKVLKDIERDKYLTPDDAKAYGIIDEIIVKVADVS